MTVLILPLHVLELVYRCRHGELTIAVPLPLPFLILQEYKGRNFDPNGTMIHHAVEATLKTNGCRYEDSPEPRESGHRRKHEICKENVDPDILQSGFGVNFMLDRRTLGKLPAKFPIESLQLFFFHKMFSLVSPGT